jgi:hypothetical protein
MIAGMRSLPSSVKAKLAEANEAPAEIVLV